MLTESRYSDGSHLPIAAHSEVTNGANLFGGRRHGDEVVPRISASTCLRICPAVGKVITVPPHAGPSCWTAAGQMAEQYQAKCKPNICRREIMPGYIKIPCQQQDSLPGMRLDFIES